MNQGKSESLAPVFFKKFKNLFLIIVITSGIVVGTVTAILYEKSILIPLLLGITSFIIFLSPRTKVYYSVVLVIISITIAKESFGIPFELDAVSAVILFIVLSISIPTSFLRKSNYVFILPLLGYLISNFLTTFFYSPFFEMSLRQNMILAYRALTYYLIIIAVTKYPNLRKNYPTWLQSLMFLNVFISTLALFVYPVLQTPFVHAKIDGSIAIKGTFQESNILGIFTLSVTAMTLSMSIYSKSVKLSVFILVLTGIAGMVLSLTRSTWLGFLVVVGCMGVLLSSKANKNAKTMYVVGVGILVSILIISLFGLFLFESFLSTSSGLLATLADRFSQLINWQETNSVMGRILIWKEALVSWQQRFWIGSGLLSFRTGVLSGQGWLYNFVIQSLHDSGLVGTILLLFFFFGNLFYAKKALNVAQNDQDRGILLGYIMAQIALYVTSLFSSFIWSAFAWTLLGLSMGHSLIIMKMNPNKTSKN